MKRRRARGSCAITAGNAVISATTIAGALVLGLGGCATPLDPGAPQPRAASPASVRTDAPPSGRATSSPSPDGLPGSSPSGDWPITVPYDEWSVPPGWDRLGPRCGMPVSELEALRSESFELTRTGDLEPHEDGGWQMGTRLTGVFPSELDAWMEPRLIWAQDGVVVDIGPLFGSNADHYVTGEVTAGSPVTVDMTARGERETACTGVAAPNGEHGPFETLAHVREGGRFQVFALSAVFLDEGTHLALSAPVEITVDDGAGG